jgi:ATP-binding cassette, subfamily B, bacterial
MRRFKLLLKLLVYRPWIFTLDVFLWSIIEILPLAQGLIIKAILDGFGRAEGLDKNFWYLVGGTVVLYIVRIAFTYAGTINYVFYDNSITGLLRQNLLNIIMKRPGAKAMNLSPGEAISRFRDDVQDVADMFDWPLDAFGKLLRASAATVILLKANARLTLMVFLPLLAVITVIQQLRSRIRKYREASRESTSKVTGAVGEMFSSVQAVQAAGAESHIIDQFKKLNQKRHRASIKDTQFVKLLETATDNVVNLGTGLILLLSASSILRGTFTIGDFALFTTYWYHIADFTNILGGCLSAYHQGCVAFDRLAAFIEEATPEELVKHEPLYLRGEPPMIEVKAEDSIGRLDTLEIKELSYSFNSSQGGIRDVSFKVKDGSFTVITGKVGCGKSTLLRAMLGLLPRDGGKILWNGREVESPGEFFVPPVAAYTAQIPHLFSDTIKNNILLGLDIDDKERIADAVYSSVLERDMEDFKDGLETVIGPRGVKLSGGQLQRVAAARMFANKAQIYFFDDISSALDVETENALWDRMDEVGSATCIAVSNRHGALERADQIIVLEEGRVAAVGTLEELLESSEEFRNIYGQKTYVSMTG